MISGNLGYQVEHHLYPDMPSTRYARDRAAREGICERYELPYNTGPFFQQWYMVQRTIVRLAFPGGKPRPKPGPYHGIETNGSGPAETPDAQARQRARRARLGTGAGLRRRSRRDAGELVAARGATRGGGWRRSPTSRSRSPARRRPRGS